MMYDFNLMLVELTPCVIDTLYMHKCVCVRVCVCTLNLCVGIVLDYTHRCDTHEWLHGNLLTSYVAFLNWIHDYDLPKWIHELCLHDML